MSHWYVIQTKVRQEHLAASHLLRQCYPVFLPIIRQDCRQRGRWRQATEPLFPGYLFSQLDLATDNTAPIRSTRGVIGLVRFNGQPCAIPTGVIDSLQSMQQAADGVICCQRLFKSGDKVIITDGPLAGLEAIFIATSTQERVCILLDFLGRQQTVKISHHHIAPADHL